MTHKDGAQDWESLQVMIARQHAQNKCVKTLVQILGLEPLERRREVVENMIKFLCPEAKDFKVALGCC